MLFKQVIILLLLFPLLLTAQRESAYIDLLAVEMNGQTEVAVPNGRVDILTNTYAIEVERARKWKNSIGQALWYAQQTNKAPGIILILESKSDFKYLQMLKSTLNYAGLGERVEVWIYPDDFQARLSETATSPPPTAGTKTNFWLTKSSKKRHRNSCKWYEKSNGRYCTANEGIAAGCCQ